MNTHVNLEKCFTFINCEIQPPGPRSKAKRVKAQWTAVTISRQTGSGAHVVAERLAELLQKHAPGSGRPWTVFDRNLVETVLEDHHLPKRLARFMPEDRVPGMTDTIDELLGLHPPSWTLVRQTSETILRLADIGNVIIIGRGANIVTAKLDHVLHVRLVGSLEKRAENLRNSQSLSFKAACQLIQEEDRGRIRYVKKHFGADIENPLLYHLVINTDWIECDQAAETIAHAMLKRNLADEQL